MVSIASAEQPAPVRLGVHRPGLGVHGPVLVVALVLALVLGPWFASLGGNPTGFIWFGRNYVGSTHPPPGALIRTPTGYDGQYFWAQATDPLLLRDRTVAEFRQADFRLQRVAYPALAYVLAAGRQNALPWSLLALNVAVVLALTAGFARYAAGRGWSPWWALAVGLLPGFVVATIGDMSDVLATASMFVGLIMWRGGRRWPAAAMLALATLSREPMTLAVAAVALETAASAWRRRRQPGGALKIIRFAWPVVALPAAVFIAWQIYLNLRVGGSVTAPGTAYQPPFVAVLAEARRAVRGGVTLSAGWDLAYLGTMLAAIGVALALLRQDLSAATITAGLLGLSLLVLTFGSDWSYTRLSAPLFAALLLTGLERQARPALTVCGLVAAMGALTPAIFG